MDVRPRARRSVLVRAEPPDRQLARGLATTQVHLHADDRKLADKLRIALGEEGRGVRVERLVRRILVGRQQAVTA